MKKKLLSLIASTLLVAMVATSYCGAVTLGITKVKQAKTNWCWAACAQMVGNWEYGDKTQYQIVSYIKGASQPNVMGTASETARGATYASNNLADFSTTGKLSSSSVQTMIDSYNNAFIAGCVYNSGSGGHMLVVHGRNSSGSLYVCDPANATSTWVTYGALSSSYGGRRWVETVYTYA